MEFLRWLHDASITIGQYHLRWTELIGVLLGLASAVLGMKRLVAAWPVGMVANVMLFFVYAGVVFGVSADHRIPLFGQAGRQVFFIATAIYGWWRWHQQRAASTSVGSAALTPRWATARERLALVGAWVGGLLVAQQLFSILGAEWPAPRWFFWCDAWIFIGSLLATYAMARGWNEFWLCWIAVDVVGVPLAFSSGYIPTGVLYAFYSLFVIYGFLVWLRATKAESGEPRASAA